MRRRGGRSGELRRREQPRGRQPAARREVELEALISRAKVCKNVVDCLAETQSQGELQDGELILFHLRQFEAQEHHIVDLEHVLETCSAGLSKAKQAGSNFPRGTFGCSGMRRTLVG